ncbi:MAG: hypothetical protein ABIY55_19500, partial [Kofleriaceae bacterium]
MLNNPAAVRSLRVWRRLAIVTAMALCSGFVMTAVRTWQGRATLVEQCRLDALKQGTDAGAQLRIGGICLAAFAWSHDPASGARAARALAKASGHRRLVEWLASAIGDSAAGADAWLAEGWSRMDRSDAKGAEAAFQRALAHRVPSDIAGRIHDTNSLIAAYRELGELSLAARAAAAAYTLSATATRADRSLTLINVAVLLR